MKVEVELETLKDEASLSEQEREIALQQMGLEWNHWAFSKLK
jgi:hypothetical protein